MGPGGRRIQLKENHEIVEYHGWTKGAFCEVIKTAEKIKGIPAALAFGEHDPSWWIASYRESFGSYAIHWQQFLPIGPFNTAAEAAVFLKLIADEKKSATPV